MVGVVGVQGPESSSYSATLPLIQTALSRLPLPPPRIWAQLRPAMPWPPHESLLYGPRGSGLGSILRPMKGEGQNPSPQAGSVHKNNGSLWLMAGMQPLSCPGPQPRGLRSLGQAGWRGSVRQALVCQGQEHMIFSFPSLDRQEGRRMGQSPPPHQHQKRSHTQDEGINMGPKEEKYTIFGVLGAVSCRKGTW